MAFVYKIESMDEGEFGPNSVGHKYKPASYHGYKAKKTKGKTRWKYPVAAEYHVFNLADEHTEEMGADGIVDKRWINDDNSGLYSMVDGCKEPLGIGEERLAFFPQTRNPNDPWHGYPIDSSNLGPNLVEHWYQSNLIDQNVYLRLLKRKL